MPTRLTCSRSSLLPSGTPDIEAPFGKQGIFSRAHDLTNFIFSSVRVSPTMVPLGANLVSACVGFLRRCKEPLRLNLLKAIIPVPRMDDIRSPRGEALRPHRIASKNHTCHGGPYCRAWCFRPAVCLAGRDPQCDHRGACPPSGGLPLIP